MVPMDGAWGWPSVSGTAPQRKVQGESVVEQARCRSREEGEAARRSRRKFSMKSEPMFSFLWNEGVGLNSYEKFPLFL
jgi:hypothetical protein